MSVAGYYSRMAKKENRLDLPFSENLIHHFNFRDESSITTNANNEIDNIQDLVDPVVQLTQRNTIGLPTYETVNAKKCAYFDTSIKCLSSNNILDFTSANTRVFFHFHLIDDWSATFGSYLAFFRNHGVSSTTDLFWRTNAGSGATRGFSYRHGNSSFNVDSANSVTLLQDTSVTTKEEPTTLEVEGSSVITGNTGFSRTSKNFTLGSDPNGDSRFGMYGYIYEVLIYDRAFTSGQITEVFNYLKS